jgi:hypothetical protein
MRSRITIDQGAQRIVVETTVDLEPPNELLQAKALRIAKSVLIYALTIPFRVLRFMFWLMVCVTVGMLWGILSRRS